MTATSRLILEGRADTEVKEARERVRAALQSSGLVTKLVIDCVKHLLDVVSAVQ